MKRAFDIIASGVALMCLSPLLLAIAFFIKALSPGPVLYCGCRVGRYGRPFRVLKFRSMVVNAEALGGSATADDDVRLTRVGRWLRKYKLDELPQLINVFRGEMSLVGPRPEVQKYVDMLSGEERRILELPPGITDWASLWNFNEGAVLAGSADAEAAYERLIRPTKIRLQQAYLADHSLMVDLKILVYTALKVLFHATWTPPELRGLPSLAGATACQSPNACDGRQSQKERTRASVP